MKTKLDNMSKADLVKMLKTLLQDEPAKTAPKKRGRRKKDVVEERVNRFDEMEDLKTAHKEDTAFDKRVWEGKTPTPRRKIANLITIQCDACKNDFQISPATIVSDQVYLCNDCIRSKK